MNAQDEVSNMFESNSIRIHDNNFGKYRGDHQSNNLCLDERYSPYSRVRPIHHRLNKNKASDERYSPYSRVRPIHHPSSDSNRKRNSQSKNDDSYGKLFKIFTSNAMKSALCESLNCSYPTNVTLYSIHNELRRMAVYKEEVDGRFAEYLILKVLRKIIKRMFIKKKILYLTPQRDKYFFGYNELIRLQKIGKISLSSKENKITKKESLSHKINQIGDKENIEPIKVYQGHIAIKEEGKKYEFKADLEENEVIVTGEVIIKEEHIVIKKEEEGSTQNDEKNETGESEDEKDEVDIIGDNLDDKYIHIPDDDNMNIKWCPRCKATFIRSDEDIKKGCSVMICRENECKDRWTYWCWDCSTEMDGRKLRCRKCRSNNKKRKECDKQLMLR